MLNTVIYNNSSVRMQEEIISKLLELLDAKMGDVIVEIGCGTGKLAALLAETVGSSGKVIATDPDEERISFAQSQYQNVCNLTFIKCKSTEFPMCDNVPYDSFVCNKTLHWIKTTEKVMTFNRIYSTLKPGGLFVGNINFHMPTNVALMISLLTPDEQSEIYSWHDRENIDIIKKMFTDSGFEILYFKEEKKNCPIGDKEMYLKWITSAFFGKFDFEWAYENRKIELDLVKDNNGNIMHDFDGMFYCVRKPTKSD